MVGEARVLVIMGVSGSGKSTVARILAESLGWELQEGDDLHPSANVEKMHAGVPLTDDDRWPWLDLIAKWIVAHIDSGTSGVITCSALKRRYRDVLRRDGVVFVYLGGSADVIRDRLEHRHGHYMPSSLLDSQLATLEPPDPDEHAIDVDVRGTPDEAAGEILARLGAMS